MSGTYRSIIITYVEELIEYLIEEIRYSHSKLKTKKNNVQSKMSVRPLTIWWDHDLKTISNCGKTSKTSRIISDSYTFRCWVLGSGTFPPYVIVVVVVSNPYHNKKNSSKNSCSHRLQQSSITRHQIFQYCLYRYPSHVIYVLWCFCIERICISLRYLWRRRRPVQHFVCYTKYQHSHRRQKKWKSYTGCLHLCYRLVLQFKREHVR